MRLVSLGCANKEIAAILGITESTADNHRSNAMAKLDVHSAGTLTRVALTLGTRLPDAVEIVKGVAPGQTVVRTGHQKLFEGAKVIPVPSHPVGERGGAAK